MANKLLIDLQYLPSIDFFTLLAYYDEVFLEAKESFQKQSYRNRTYILGANNIERLSIPIIHHTKDATIQEIELEYKQNCQAKHWRAISSAYGNAPYFEYFAYVFEEILNHRCNTLWELNLQLLTTCLDILGLKTKIRHTDAFMSQTPDGYDDWRNHIHPKKDTICGKHIHYPQVFGSNFEKNLSILDLIFSLGRESKSLLIEQTKFLKR